MIALRSLLIYARLLYCGTCCTFTEHRIRGGHYYCVVCDTPHTLPM